MNSRVRRSANGFWRELGDYTTSDFDIARFEPPRKDRLKTKEYASFISRRYGTVFVDLFDARHMATNNPHEKYFAV